MAKELVILVNNIDNISSDEGGREGKLGACTSLDSWFVITTSI